jgi:hypothetical protein
VDRTRDIEVRDFLLHLETRDREPDETAC